ncbi:MAG: SGNH/GDSL hydrolase family protein [Verrucomicrobiota bacterium]|nr:SGNH/GDSL hydrolase family protein [Verrucomicrobiota bacterium]
MKITHRRCPSLLAALALSLSLNAGSSAQETKPARPRRPEPAFQKVIDVPGLPRVLLIGDSISIGYTVDVQKLLAGKANVHRIPTNGGPTTNGLAHLKEWLGAGSPAQGPPDSQPPRPWDVIHFNWGLHDLKFMLEGNRQVGPEDYEKNLRELVKLLKGTGAKLIWCSTTPVPEGKLTPERKNEDVVAYNAIARRVMDENGVAIDDLYAFALPQLGEIQLPRNVHFKAEGSAVLAKQVARSIEAALPAK